MNNIIEYIIEFLLNGKNDKFIAYSKEEEKDFKITIIRSNFFEDDFYGTKESVPRSPFKTLFDLPILYGESKIDYKDDGRIILYADYIASSYFLMSRYQEFVNKSSRDIYGRFLAKHSEIFKAGYGFIPLVDEWGKVLRKLLNLHIQNGVKKVYLTHDIDIPFQYPYFRNACRVCLSSLIKHRELTFQPLVSYFNVNKDKYYNFERIFEYDNKLKKNLNINTKIVNSIYFIITAGKKQNKSYCDITIWKYKKLINKIIDNEDKLGLHVSYEADNQLTALKDEIKKLPPQVDKKNLLSRNHFLRWTEPEFVDNMEMTGIKEDYSLGYADSVGFRCGTCRPYYFINPKTKRLTNLLIHPLLVMECSLTDPDYMNLDYNEALNVIKKIIDKTIEFNGEFNVLFHNNYFGKGEERDILYSKMIDYLCEINNN